MSWFNNNKKVYPTKMFVNYLSDLPQTKGMTFKKTRSITGSLLSTAMGIKGVAIDMVISAAPKLIDQGMKLMSDTISSMAEDKIIQTTVKRNFDVINPARVSLPSKITLVRGEFATDATQEGEIFGDGEKKNRNQVVLLGNKELHIEIDIVKSKDNRAIYFQPTSYFYCGESSDGEKISEIVLAFAFLEPDKTLLNIKDVTFQNFLHFEALESNKHYNFTSPSGCDNSFQSTWMKAPLSDNIPYTMVIQIQEIKEGSSFAKLLQTVYLENEKYIKTELNQKASSLKESK